MVRPDDHLALLPGVVGSGLDPQQDIQHRRGIVSATREPRGQRGADRRYAFGGFRLD